MKMTDMKMSKKETERMATPAEVASESPEYPYGICLNLHKEEIKKLGLGTPKAGSKLMLHAMVEVKSVTVTDEKGGEGYKSVDLQITDMAIEKPGMNMEKARKALYGEE